MRPYQIILFLLSIFLSMSALILVFPDDGIKVTGSFRIRFSNLDDLLQADTIQYPDIHDIIEEYGGVDSFDILSDRSVAMPEKSTAMIAWDSAAIRIPVCAIEKSPNNPDILYPIFNDLLSLQGTRDLIRILHYGDSQIELDRITSYIRNKLQLTFGGSGPGMLAPVPSIPGSISVRQAFSGNWEKIYGFGNADSAPDHNKLGVMFSFAREDASIADTSENKVSWIRVSPTSLGYSTSRIFNNVSLYLANTEDTTLLKLMINDTIVDHKTLVPGGPAYKLNWILDTTPKELYLSMEGKGRPELYGLTLDHSWGVAVDNIPLRGSSGLVFSKADTSFLRKMYEDLNVRMIILQFGGNIVPMNAPDYSFYENYFRRELSIIKRMLPDVPVIVIGPSDMSVREGDDLITYPGLIKVRDAIRNASLGSGYAFWDMFKAMGGQNSMPGWVNADPPLASPDFVHFTYRGSRIIAEMFYNAFMYDFYQWYTAELSAEENDKSIQSIQ